MIHLLQHWDEAVGSAIAEEMKLMRPAVLELCVSITWEHRNANSAASIQTSGWGPTIMLYKVLSGWRTPELDKATIDKYWIQ